MENGLPCITNDGLETGEINKFIFIKLYIPKAHCSGVIGMGCHMW